jgi:hypothetical protein
MDDGYNDNIRNSEEGYSDEIGNIAKKFFLDIVGRYSVRFIGCVASGVKTWIIHYLD